MPIISFRNRDVEKLGEGDERGFRIARRFKSVERSVIKRLTISDIADTLDTLMLTPGNRFHALRGNRKGQYAISINTQWRICSEWHDDNTYNIEIIDYH